MLKHQDIQSFYNHPCMDLLPKLNLIDSYDGDPIPLVFMRRSHIPKLKTTFPSEVLVASDKRSYKNMTFDNVLARWGSSFCNRARLNFQAFPLRDMRWRPEMAVA